MDKAMSADRQVRTRFAPSPTGSMHIGNLRTALYAYVLAKHNSGDFILRIEDTDKKREIVGGIETIKNLLVTFGLNWDEFYIQSDRLQKYQEAARKLVRSGNAFYCQCQPKNAKKQGYSEILRDPCREKKLTAGAIKLKVPDKENISFSDFVLEKEISWEAATVSDTTLLKSDGFPTYHLAAVVDDYDMKISHVLRGHDWMPSTPIHILVYQFLGYKMPQIGHLTDILDPEGGKLSKRKGSTSCEGLLAEGYLPEAILNFIMLLGWAPKDNREIFSLAEFIKVFDKNGLQKSNPIFNREKLDWFNGEYIRKTQNSKLKTQIFKFYAGKYPEDKIESILPLVKDRIKTLREFGSLAGFFFEQPKVNLKLLGKNFETHLNSALKTLESIEFWKKEKIDERLLSLIKEKRFKTGDFFMDLRIAITASRFTPPINESIVILGKKETLKRIKEVLN